MSEAQDLDLTLKQLVFQILPCYGSADPCLLRLGHSPFFFNLVRLSIIMHFTSITAATLPDYGQLKTIES